MSGDVLNHVAENSPATGDGDAWAKSYFYTRIAMVGLLVGLGAAVTYQTAQQGWHLLGSVSAYYYTPAQALFVGGLIGLGACMIALKGTTNTEDAFLNLGGMFASVVAVVPTARSEDYVTAVRACKHAGNALLTHRASPTVDCPTIEALAKATQDNVENNMTALLVVGALGLLATLAFALISPSSPAERVAFRWGFGAAVLLWAVAAFTFFRYLDWFIDHAHYIAAGGLFVCIVIVALVNALRRQNATGPLVRPRRGDPYAWIAWLMLGAGIVLSILDLAHVISLFWLEIVVTFLFLVFWTAQTIEQVRRQRTGTA